MVILFLCFDLNLWSCEMEKKEEKEEFVSRFGREEGTQGKRERRQRGLFLNWSYKQSSDMAT